MPVAPPEGSPPVSSGRRSLFPCFRAADRWDPVGSRGPVAAAGFGSGCTELGARSILDPVLKKRISKTISKID